MKDEIEFSTRGIHDIFPTTTKKTLIFGIPSNFKYYSTELRTKHTLVAMVTTTVCNDFIAHRLEGI
jgi:hypothetical protein